MTPESLPMRDLAVCLLLVMCGVELFLAGEILSGWYGQTNMKASATLMLAQKDMRYAKEGDCASIGLFGEHGMADSNVRNAYGVNMNMRVVACGADMVRAEWFDPGRGEDAAGTPDLSLTLRGADGRAVYPVVSRPEPGVTTAISSPVANVAGGKIHYDDVATGKKGESDAAKGN